MNTNDEIEIEKLFKANYSPLYVYALQMVNDTEASRDIVSDAFEYLWKNYHKIDVSAFRSCLYVFVRTKCIDYLRHMQVHEQYVRFCTTVISEETESDIQELEERSACLQQGIERLSPRTRHILEECYVRKKKYREVAAELEISPSAVRKHISKALGILRGAFAKKE